MSTETSDKVRAGLQIMLIIWFVVASLFVFIPSFDAMARIPADSAISPPPRPPELPASANEWTAALYTQQVAAYQEQVLAYTAYSQMVEKMEQDSVYESVVTKTILPLLEKMIVAFLAYAFVVAAATTVDNVNRLRHSKEPESIRLL